MGRSQKDNRLFTLLCCPCCGGYKGSQDAFYFCGCRVYHEDDFCTKDGCISCLLSQGSRFWIIIATFIVWTLFQAGILYAIQPEVFEAGTSMTHLGNSSAFAMAIYFSWTTDTTICYGDILMNKEPANGRVALFFLASVGMLIVGLGIGATANAMLQCLRNDPRTGYKFLDRILSFFAKPKIFTFFTIYIGLLLIGATIFMWLPYIESPYYGTGNTTLLPEEHWSFDEAFYWGWATFTSCGYGDLYPASVTGRFLLLFWGTIAIGFFGSTISLTAIWFETNFDRILHSRLSRQLRSKQGQKGTKYAREFVDQVRKDFPLKEAQKEFFELMRDCLDDEIDKTHTHLGTQGKFGSTHGHSHHTQHPIHEHDTELDGGSSLRNRDEREFEDLSQETTH